MADGKPGRAGRTRSGPARSGAPRVVQATPYPGDVAVGGCVEVAVVAVAVPDVAGTQGARLGVRRTLGADLEVAFANLGRAAHAVSDLTALREVNRARAELFRMIGVASDAQPAA